MTPNQIERELRHAAAVIGNLAGASGPPEAVQTIADAYPGSTSSHVVYDLGIGLSLAIGDLADQIDAAAVALAARPGGDGFAVALTLDDLSVEAAPPDPAPSTSSRSAPAIADPRSAVTSGHVAPAVRGSTAAGGNLPASGPAAARVSAAAGGSMPAGDLLAVGGCEAVGDVAAADLRPGGNRVVRRVCAALATIGSRRIDPIVHPWMVRSSDAAWEAAGKLQVHRDWLADAAATASELLDTHAAKAFWQGRDQHRSPQAVAVDLGHALGQAQAAFERLAIAIDRYGPPLRELLRRAGRAQLKLAEPTYAQVRAYTDALSTADATCRQALESAVQALSPTKSRPTQSDLVTDTAHARAGPANTPTAVVPAHPGDQDRPSLAARVAGHRRQLRAELASLRRDDAAFERLATAHRHADSNQHWQRLAGRITTAWLVRDRVGKRREDLRTRARLYESLLNDRVSDGQGDVRLRQVIEFDPVGAGRIAELWGPEPSVAAAVAIFVPGTGTAMRGFHLPTAVARDLASADPRGQTAVIAWMGADFPPALGAAAIRAGYARAAAPTLRDHIAGLGVSATTPVTLIGHSYGGPIVGAAECLGVRAERVIHLASAGAGPGVGSVRDYPRLDHTGRPRAVRRYALRAPGDPVALARTVRAVTGGRADLGVDPARLDGVQVLPAGVWEADAAGHRRGDPLRGTAGHAQVTMPGTTAFRLMVEIITGVRLDPQPRLG